MSRKSSVSKKEKEVVENCATCNKSEGSSDDWLQCEVCDSWHHASCVDVSKATFDACKKIKNLHWICNNCNPQVIKTLKLLTNITARQDKTEQEVQSLQTELQKLKQSMDEMGNKIHNLVEAKLTGEVKRNVEQQVVEFKDIVKQQLEEEMQTKVDDTVKRFTGNIQEVKKSIQETKEQADEHRDKESRRNNIIIYNVPESEEPRLDDRNRCDIAFCLQMFNSCMNLGITEDDFVNVFRLGRRGESARPLLIQLVGYNCKNIIMESLYKLRHADRKFKGIIVAHDMTKIEREECKRLVADAKSQNDEDTSGEYTYKVRGLPGQMRIVKFRVRGERN